MTDPPTQWLISFLAEHGPMFLLAATVLLALGAGALLAISVPIHRQRVAEATIAAVFIWGILAGVPLPRWAPNWLTANKNAPREYFPPAPSAAVAVEPSPAEQEHTRPQLAAEPAELSPTALGEPPGSRPTDSPLPINHSAPPAAGPALLAGDGAKSLWAAPADFPGSALKVAAIDWPTWWAALYLAGAAVCMAWLVVGRLLLAALLRRSQEAPDWLLDELAKLSDEKQTVVQLRISAACARPFSCGLWRPVIVLPDRCRRKDRRTQLQHVLRHELAHVVQGDGWGRLLMNAALPWLYFHPLYWLLRRQQNLAAELVADDLAARESSPAAYADSLLDLLKELRPPRINPLGVVSVYQSQSQFYRRMEMLVTRNAPLDRRCSRWWSAGLLAALAAAVVFSSATMGVAVSPAAEPPLEGQLLAAAEPADAAANQSKNAAAANETKTAAAANAAVDGRLFVHVEEEQTIFMIDAKTGQTIQKVRVRPDAQHVFPGTQRRRFLYSPGDNKMFLIEPDEKEFKPVNLLTLESTAAFTADGNSYLVRSIDGGLEAVESRTSQPLWRSQFTQAPSEPSSAAPRASAAAPTRKNPNLAESTASPAQRQTAPWQVSSADRQLDLVALANAYVEALGEEEILSAQLGQSQRLQEKQPGVISDEELRRIEVGLKTARRKIMLYSAIADAGIAASRQEYEAVRNQYAQNDQSESQQSAFLAHIAQLEGRIRMLQLILDAK